MTLFLIKLRRDIKYIANLLLQLKLRPLMKEQKKVFDEIKSDFKPMLEGIKKFENDRFMTPAWKSFVAKVEKSFLPVPDFKFLSTPIILFTMFVTAGGEWMRKQVEFLETVCDKDDLNRILKEDAVGEPLLLEYKYTTSHNSVHHLYSIERYFKLTGRKPEEIKSVVEWGGGYGNMAKIFYRKMKRDFTYVIIDVPVFSVIQWMYLYITVGKDRINLITQPLDKVQEGKINLLPVCFAEGLNGPYDLFVSTWALSESNKEAQDFVMEKKFFGASKILLANQTSDKSFPYAENLINMVGKMNAKTESIEFLKGNYYIFV